MTKSLKPCTIQYKNCQKLLEKEIESLHYFTFVTPSG